jgi:hypothetical protein
MHRVMPAANARDRMNPVRGLIAAMPSVRANW